MIDAMAVFQKSAAELKVEREEKEAALFSLLMLFCEKKSTFDVLAQDVDLKELFSPNAAPFEGLVDRAGLLCEKVAQSNQVIWDLHDPSVMFCQWLVRYQKLVQWEDAATDDARKKVLLFCVDSTNIPTLFESRILRLSSAHSELMTRSTSALWPCLCASRSKITFWSICRRLPIL